MNKIELALANIIELITTRQRKLCASLIPRCRELTVFLTINPSEIEAPSNRKVRIEEINIENYNELNRFTYLANKSYGRSETPEEVKKRLTESSLTNFRKAYIFSKNESPIGTISLGCYKKNPSVGHFRYVGVLPSRQGQGWENTLVYLD